MSANKALLDKAIGAASWGYAGTAVKLVIQLGVQVLLARILGPVEYGVFAIGVIVIAFALFFGDVASSALIPRKDLSPEQIRFAFTWQLIVSAIVTSIIFLLAGPIAQFVHEPRTESVLQALSFICVLNAIGGVGLAILRRHLNYKIIQVAQIIGYFVGYVLVALPWSLWWTPSVDALVAAWLIQVAVTSVIFYLAAPHSIVPKFSCHEGKTLILFGWHSLLSNLGTWATTNLDRVVIARSFPAAQVGLYATSYNLLSTPLNQIYATFQSVVFSATARLEDGSNGAGKVFAGLVLFVTLVVGIAYGFTFATAEQLVEILYGEKWAGAAPFIQAFSVALTFNAISGIVSPLLWASGAIKYDAKIQLATTFILATSTILASQYSVLAVGWAIASCSALRALFLVSRALRHFNLNASLFLRGFIKIGAYQLVLIGLSMLGIYGLALLQCSSVIKIALVAILHLIGFVLALRIRLWFGEGFGDVINLITKRLPKNVRWIITS